MVVKTLTRILDTVEAKTARELLDAIEKKYIAAIQAEFDASNLARKNKDTKAVKPADLFRKYQDLKAIWQRNGQFATLAHGLFIDIYAKAP